MSGGFDGLVHLWDLQSGIIRRLFRLPGPAQVATVAFSHDGKQILAGSYSRRPWFDSGIPRGVDPRAFDVWDIQTGSKSRTFKAHQGNILQMLFLPGDKSLLSISDDGTGQLVDLETGRLQVVVPKQDGPLKCAAIDPAGSLVLVGCLDGTISLWRMPGR